MFKLSISNASAVDKQTLVDDMMHFIEAFKNSQNASFEYVTESATFNIQEANKTERKSIFVDGACHMCCHH